jgi:SAM-dependent methyltransferase
MSATSFTSVAEFYDELMKPVPYRMWVSYYLLLLSMQEVKPKSMLEMCCGTGTLTELLHKEGFEIEGFDLSESMVQIARDKASRKKLPLRYEIMNASNADMGRQFDSVFSFFDSLNNIINPADLQEAFFTAANHIPDGGSFIFDLNTAYAFRAKMFNQQDLSKKSKVRYRWRGDWNEESQLIQVRMKFWVGETEFEEVHVQRAYTIDEVVPMLEQAGFAKIRTFHSYTLEQPREKSDRIHFACIKSG